MCPLGGPARCRGAESGPSGPCLFDIRSLWSSVNFAPDVHRIAPDPVIYRDLACIETRSDLDRIWVGSVSDLGWVGSDLGWICVLDLGRIWIGSGSDLYRIWVESGSDLFRIWVGSVSDVGSELYASVSDLCRIWIGSGWDQILCQICVDLDLGRTQQDRIWVGSVSDLGRKLLGFVAGIIKMVFHN